MPNNICRLNIDSTSLKCKTMNVLQTSIDSDLVIPMRFVTTEPVVYAFF